MAHCIAQTADGAFQFAYAGDPGWHGLGQKVTQGADIATWAREAHMDFTIEARPLYFRPSVDTPAQGAPMPKARVLADLVVQTRSDTGAPLGTVSPSFQTVQPIETLEFFKEYAELSGAQIETAGVLHGRRDPADPVHG